MSDLGALTRAIEDGDRTTAVGLTRSALDEGTDPTVVLAAMTAAMDVVGRRFQDGDIFVPEMLVSARAMKESLAILEPVLTAAGVRPAHTAIVGTVEGDLHDIGKNLVAMMWKGAGIDVVDLGVNVKPDRFVEAAREHGARLIGVSALLSTTMANMRRVVDAVRASGLDAWVVIGGAPTTPEFAAEIGADGHAIDAGAAVDLARGLLGEALARDTALFRDQPSAFQTAVAEVVSGGRARPAVVGRTLFDDADDLSVDVPASCARTGRCRECIVTVTEGESALSPRDDAELFLLHPYRLACQARIVRNDVPIAFASVRRPLRILVTEEEPAPELDAAVDVRDGIVHWDGEPIEPVRRRVLGLAIDLGTTTIVFELVDLVDGHRVALGALENPQVFGGSDVVTRIAYDALHPGLLRQAVRRALNRELRRAYAVAGVDRREVYEVYLVGNTTMRDLFFGLDVAPIGRSPFQSVMEVAMRSGQSDGTAIVRLGHEAGLLVHPQARVVGGPLIACHVGADAAADLVAAGAMASRTPFLLIDIGTNTEVVAGTSGRLVAASCPAGPAFEGGVVRHGMPAAQGAIELLAIVDGRFALQTIGGGPPVGLCGSGLVDLLAELLRTGRLTPGGRFEPGEDTVAVTRDPPISLSRLDVSHLAQAKSANLVGQQILLRALGLAPDGLVDVFLAGGFASHLDVGRAIAIGLLLPVPLSRVRRLGNASLRGARMLLLSRRLRARLAEVVRGIEHVQLEAQPDFFERYVDGCAFGVAAALAPAATPAPAAAEARSTRAAPAPGPNGDRP